MRSKGVWVPVATLVVLLGVASVYTLRERRPPTRSPYASVEADSILRVEIEKRDTTIVFERRADKWELTYPLSYPIDQTLLDNLLKGLRELKLEEAISTNPEKFSSFQVDEEGGVLVRAYGRGENPLISVILGKMASDFQRCYLRFPDKNEVRLALGPSRYMADRKVDDWKDKTILSFDREKAVELSYIYRDKREFRLTEEEGKWILGEEEVDSTKVNAVLDLLANFKADGFRDGAPAEGEIASGPEFLSELTIAIKLEGQSEQKLLIGKEEEKGKYSVKRGDAETTFWVYAWKIDRLRKEEKEFRNP